MSISSDTFTIFAISVGFGISFGRFDWVQNISGGQLSFYLFYHFYIVNFNAPTNKNTYKSII